MGTTFKIILFFNTMFLISCEGLFDYSPYQIDFEGKYWIKRPSHYPPEYYWWSPGKNAGIFIGGELKTNWLALKNPASETAVYARIGTLGLYLASKVGNSSIPITDIIELGFGIALYH